MRGQKKKSSFSSSPQHPCLSTLNALFPCILHCVILRHSDISTQRITCSSFLSSLQLPYPSLPFPSSFDPARPRILFLNNRILTLFHPLLLLLLSSPAPHSSPLITHIANMFALRRAALPTMSLVKTTKHTHNINHIPDTALPTFSQPLTLSTR